jgi:hypothetical protein
LEADRESVALNPEADPSAGFAEHPERSERTGQVIWLDVAAFQARLAQARAHGHPRGETCPECLAALTEAAALYRDDFLAGFTLTDSPAFDD